MRKNTDANLDRIRAARKAFDAYERAVTAAKKVIADGPASGPGAAVMRRSERSLADDFTCSECQGHGKEAWKFCAFCGSEIIRFERREQPEKVLVVVDRGER